MKLNEHCLKGLWKDIAKGKGSLLVTPVSFLFILNNCAGAIKVKGGNEGRFTIDLL